MSYLSTSDLEWMRSQILATLPDTAVIYTPTYVSDGEGGWGAGSSVAGTVACRLDPLQAPYLSEVVAKAEVQIVRYRLTIPHDTTINTDDRVVVNGRTYETVQLDIDHSWNVSKRVIVSEIR